MWLLVTRALPIKVVPEFPGSEDLGRASGGQRSVSVTSLAVGRLEVRSSLHRPWCVPLLDVRGIPLTWPGVLTLVLSVQTVQGFALATSLAPVLLCT